VRPPAKRLPYESGVPGSNPGPSASQNKIPYSNKPQSTITATVFLIL
jgi:hypothetical protein